jgi:hypothetical protein
MKWKFVSGVDDKKYIRNVAYATGIYIGVPKYVNDYYTAMGSPQEYAMSVRKDGNAFTIR